MCSLGVFGTKYVRESQVPSQIEAIRGTRTTFTVEKIRSHFAIGNPLDINLRLKYEALSYVSFTELAESTEVHIDAQGMEVGKEFTLTLESFNTLSIAQSSLKTDSIKVNIVEGEHNFNSDLE